MVVADSTGEALASCAGPVWANLPHTSPAGEFCGLAAACQLAKGCAKHLFADYMGVVKAIPEVGLHLQRRCGFYAGTLRDACQSKGAKLITEATHVKSHQADSGHLPAGITEEEAIAISGNQVADQLATDTLEAHPEFDKDLWDKAKKGYFMAKNVCHIAALALPE